MTVPTAYMMVRPCPCLLVICLLSLLAEFVKDVPSESKEEDCRSDTRKEKQKAG